MDFGELLSKSWNDYKKNFNISLKSFWWFMILPAIIFGIIALAIIVPFIGSMPDVSKLNVANPDFSGLLSYFGGYLWGFIAIFIAYTLVSLILGTVMSVSLYFAALHNENGKMNFKQSVKGGMGFFWRVIGLFFYILFIIIIILLPGAVAILLTWLFFVMKIYALGVIFVVIDILLAIGEIILLVYLSISWIFSVPVMINENKGIRESMKRSKAIVKGRWWRVFGFMILLGLILFLVSLVFSLPGEIIGRILSYAYDSADLSAGIAYGLIIYAIDSIFSIAASLITTPLSIFFTKNFYLDLSNGKEKK